MTLLCIAPGCSVPRHHSPSCNDEDCRGCLPAVAEVGQLCTRDFNHEASVLVEIGELYERLKAGWPDATAAHDPLGVSLPAGPVSRSGAPKVSGTPGRSVPTSLDVLDLLAPARIGDVSARRSYEASSYWVDDYEPPIRVCRCGWPLRTVEGHKPGPDAAHDWRDWRDQTGQPSVAAVLDLWARDWHTYIPDALPDPTVPDLLRWLRARWEWAAKNHPAVDDFIRETNNLRGRLMAVLRELEPDSEHCLGVPCRSCNQRNLWRRADGSGTVDCQTCGLIYQKEEYDRWAGQSAAYGKRERAELAAMVREHHDGTCPNGHQAVVDDVVLTDLPGMVKVTYSCRCEQLATPTAVS